MQDCIYQDLVLMMHFTLLCNRGEHAVSTTTQYRSESFIRNHASVYQSLSFEGIGLPTDLWLPTTARIQPQESWQAAIGAAKNFCI